MKVVGGGGRDRVGLRKKSYCPTYLSASDDSFVLGFHSVLCVERAAKVEVGGGGLSFD